MASASKTTKAAKAPEKKTPAVKKSDTASKAVARSTPKVAPNVESDVVKAPAKAAVKSAAKPVSKPASKTKAAPGEQAPVMDSGRRMACIEVAAYYIAERRGFAPGNAMDDWLVAEGEIDRLIAEGRLSA